MGVSARVEPVFERHQPIAYNRVNDEDHDEGLLHYLACEGRWVLRWAIGLCIVGTVVVMVSPMWFVAFIPAVIMFVCIALLVVANAVEKRSDPRAHQFIERAESAHNAEVVEDLADAHTFDPVTVQVIRREGMFGFLAVFGIVLLALLLAYIAFPTRVLAIGALIVFAYMLFVAAPFWLASVNDDVEQEYTKRNARSQQESNERVAEETPLSGPAAPMRADAPG